MTAINAFFREFLLSVTNPLANWMMARYSICEITGLHEKISVPGLAFSVTCLMIVPAGTTVYTSAAISHRTHEQL